MLAPFVVMCRKRPICDWDGAILLTNSKQKQWNVQRLTRCITAFHSKGSKATFLNWLAHSNYKHAWHVEDDAYLHQTSWHTISRVYAHRDADILGVPLDRQIGGFVERNCNICNATNVVKFAWPIVRISRRLARTVIHKVKTSVTYGHHEVLIGTMCSNLRWCRVDLHKHRFVGYIEMVGGGVHKRYLQNITFAAGKVYHPVHCPHPNRN